MDYKDGEVIAEEGAKVESVQIILGGGAVFTHAVAKKGDEKGNEKGEVVERVARVIDAAATAEHRGAWIGEAWDPDYVQHSRHAHTITVVGKTQAVRFDVKKFHGVVDADPAAAAAAERLQLDDLAGKLDAYERAHDVEVVCMKAKVELLRKEVERLEKGEKGREGKKTGWWSARSLHLS